MNQTRRPMSWRAIALGSFVTLGLVALALNLAASAIDESALAGPEDGWGMTFSSFIITVVYGSVPILLSLVASLVAAFGGPHTARAAAWCIAVLSVLSAFGLAAVAALSITRTTAETAFGVVSLLLALVLLVPLVLCVERARWAQPEDARATSVA
ncbi:hypothetical protein [Nocardioides sp.]|uniref:hypothetical protein n=1 Tax=Nocardioides sp. TaxID=35761 RepID=UPI002B66CD12|nr:hypothetical protein [Nocardioides sp.]HXH76952.1 hypothetical protein [Nocardioides sp.]